MKLMIRDKDDVRRELTWRWLTPQDIDTIQELEDIIEEALHDNSLYRRDTVEDILYGMAQGAGSIGGFVEGQLVCVRFVSFPGKYNLAERVIEPQYWDRVLHLESIIVHPDFRGNALQVRSFYYLLAHLPTEVKYLFSTVSPYNLPSLKSMFKYGSVGVDIRCLYPTEDEPEGVLRYVGVRGLIEQTDFRYETIRRTDIDRQIELLNEGYVATGLLSDDEVRFQKVLRTAVPMRPLRERQ